MQKGSKYFTLQSNQRCIKELQIHIKTCSFELGQFCLKVTHTSTHTLLKSLTPRHILCSTTHAHTTATCVHLHVSRVFVSTAGVGHDVQVGLVRLCHNEVVHNPALLIGEEGQRTLRKSGWLEMSE